MNFHECLPTISGWMTDKPAVNCCNQAITLTENRPDFRSTVKTRYSDISPVGSDAIFDYQSCHASAAHVPVEA
jgi:hypothetical protein